MPEAPEPGLIAAGRYALAFTRARWQRRGAIKLLAGAIKDDTAALDHVLSTLGSRARQLGVDNQALGNENAAIDAAVKRRADIEHSQAELSNRQAEETNKFVELEAERQGKVGDSEAAVDRAQVALGELEAQRRGLRDKRKTVERQQKGYLKAAEDREEQAGKTAMGDARAGLRRAAEDLRRDAAALDPERQELERRMSALERPISQAMVTVEALRAELDAARRSLGDVREGHRHRLAELEAEQGRKSRELSQAESEIQRRMVTLGTLINLHRIERPELAELYANIDGLRSAIGACTTEIDRLTLEREAYDRTSLVRGFLVLGGGVVALIMLVVMLAALI